MSGQGNGGSFLAHLLVEEKEEKDEPTRVPKRRRLICDGNHWAMEWKCVVERAEKGDAESQYLVGLGYEQGNGIVLMQYKSALEWYAKAMAQGHVKSMGRSAGLCYWMYSKTSKITFQLQMLRYAMDQGDVISRQIMAVLYWKGKRVPEDETKALEWMRRAASQGDEVAMVYLCAMDSNDYKLEELLSLTEGLRTHEAMYALAMIYNRRKKGPFVIPRDKKMALEWFIKSAKAGNTGSMLELYGFYECDPEHLKVALHWLMEGALRGDPCCQYEMGIAHSRGEMGFRVDKVAAVQWLSRAASQDHYPALLALCTKYKLGRGVVADTVKALDLCKRAVHFGSLQAMFRLSKMYRDGVGCLPDNAMYIQWCIRASAYGYGSAVDEHLHLYRLKTPHILHDMKEIQSLCRL